MLKVSAIIMFLLFCADCFGQEEHLLVVKPDTIYYPFYNGVQMIEVDNIEAWRENMMNDYDKFHTYFPFNEYFFRNRKGRIVKAFNSQGYISCSLQELTKKFGKIPRNKVTVTHMKMAMLRKSIWENEPTGLLVHVRLQLQGDYEIREWGRDSSSIYFGRIDSLGFIKAPAVYETLSDLGKNLLVYKDNKFGVISEKGEVLLPLKYDAHDYGCYSDVCNFVVFSEKKRITKLYNIESGRTYDLAGYDALDFTLESYGMIQVYRANLLGLIDLKGRMLLSPLYEKILSVKNCGDYLCLQVIDVNETSPKEIKIKVKS